MEEKKYLKWYNKVGYGSGDLAGNVVYAFLSSFVMLYLTNTVGLNPGIIGTLIMVSKKHHYEILDKPQHSEPAKWYLMPFRSAAGKS